MRLPILPVALLSGLLGAGVAVGIIAWEPWNSGEESGESVSGAFCDEAAKWHAAQDPFFRRVNEEGSRSGDGLIDTYEIFNEAAEQPIPTAHSEIEEAIRTLMLNIVRVHEAWLAELHDLDAVRGFPTRNPQEQEELFRANRESQARRIEGNDLLRQTNSLLGDACGLPSLEIYSP